jgi:hypothetical protein
MPRVLTMIFAAVFVGLCLAAGATLQAQEFGNDNSPPDSERDQTWYRQTSTYQPDTRAIIHQKAQARGAQRDARLASLNWYGMSNSRPTAAPTPFSSLYSPVWQQPGGRPFAWSTTSWPTSVVYVR